MSETAPAPEETEQDAEAPQKLPATPAAAILTGTLVAVYCLQIAFDATGGIGLVRMGATSPLFWVQGHYWTIASSTLLHIGAFHLACNAYFVWVVGRQIELAVGPWRMLTVFFVGGLCGSGLSVLVSPDVVSAGASGGAWGLMIALLVLLVQLSRKLGEPPLERASSLLTLIALNGVISVLPGINGLAHLGGGIGGGAVLWLSLQIRRGWAVPALGLAVLHAIALGVAAQVGQPWAWSQAPVLEEREFFDGAVSTRAPVLREEMLAPGIAVYGDGTWDGMSVEYRIFISEEDPDETGAAFAESLGVPAIEVSCEGSCRLWWYDMPGGILITSVRDYESIVIQATSTIWTSRLETLDDAWGQELVTAARLTRPAWRWCARWLRTPGKRGTVRRPRGPGSACSWTIPMRSTSSTIRPGSWRPTRRSRTESAPWNSRSGRSR